MKDKLRKSDMKEIILHRLKFTQVIYERTGNCVRVISIDRGSYGPKSKNQEGYIQRKGKTTKPQSITMLVLKSCSAEFPFKLFKLHMRFSS